MHRFIAYLIFSLSLMLHPQHGFAASVISPADVEVVNPFGDTLVEAKAEAEFQTVACRRTGHTCQPKALSPRQLVPADEQCGGVFPAMAWRRAEELAGSDQYIAYLQDRASRRELFSCSGAACLAVIPTCVPREKETGVTTLSVCSVDVVQGVPGPPNRCKEAIKRHKGDVVLLHGQIGTFYTARSMGLRDFDAIFEGLAGRLATVRKLVGKVLRAKPFNLAVMEDGKAVVGTRAHLASEVITGWREWITVRVEIDARGADAGTTIFTTMLVSKQATTSRDAWTPPSEPQEAAYLLALRNAFQRRGGVLSTGVGR